MNNKYLIFAILIAVVGSALARPCGPCRPGPYRPCPPPPPPHHHNSSWWGRGGCNFWPSFVGGMTGAAIGTAVASRNSTVVVERQTVVAAPTVVTTPAVVQPAAVTTSIVVKQPVQVWIDGHYVDQAQANGTVIRVWQPGHYEYR